MRKPANIVYGLDDSPPPHITVLNGIQYVGLIAINLVYPLLVFRVAEAPFQLVANLLAIGMLVLGAGTFLQVLRLGPVGSGFMCPATFTATYLGPSLLAAHVGGLPLVFGMTIFAGVLETAIAPLLNRLRAVFPPEVSGLVIFIIGLSGGIAGVRALLGAKATPVSVEEWWVAGLTLAAMVALNVWGKGMARMLCALIGLLIGYVAAGFAGLIGGTTMLAVEEAPWIGLPAFALFAIACVAAAMKTVGTITVCQRMNDADWVRPDMRSITRSAGRRRVDRDCRSCRRARHKYLDTGGRTCSGDRNGEPQGGVCRWRDIPAPQFFPKLPALLAVMPRAVIVASVLFAVTFIMINGLQVMSSRMLDARRTLVIGLSIVAGVTVEVFPTLAAAAPKAASSLVGSSLVFSALIALVLNLLFRLGVKKTATLKEEGAQINPKKIEDFMEAQGALWGARRDVIDRASFNLTQSIETIVEGCEPQGPLEVAATFDEFNLDLRVMYSGPPLELPEKRPTNEEIMESEEGQRRLAGFMLRRYADRVAATHRNGRSTILFHFDH